MPDGSVAYIAAVLSVLRVDPTASADRMKRIIDASSAVSADLLVGAGGGSRRLAFGDDAQYAVGVGHDVAFLFTSEPGDGGASTFSVEYGRVTKVARKTGSGKEIPYCYPVRLEPVSDDTASIQFHGYFYEPVPKEETDGASEEVKAAAAQGRAFRYRADASTWENTACELTPHCICCSC
jgi:hypothetical protein